jgi:hypothetical protein
MGAAVSESFAALLERLAPEPGARPDAEKHHKALESALRTHTGAVDLVAAGSSRFRTGVKGHSPLDVLVVLQWDPARPNSATTLRAFADVVAHAVPNVQTTVTSWGVVVPFGPGRADCHQLIPAQLLELGESGGEIYVIPDGAGGWTRTSPSLHARYLDTQDRRADAAARPLVRFVKAWKHLNDVPISSFYLELAAAAYVGRERSVSYTRALSEILKELVDGQLAPLNDPACVSGPVKAVDHVFHRARALETLRQGLDHVVAARDAARKHDVEQALAMWNRFYNGAFIY